jgi:hypothetical protein
VISFGIPEGSGAQVDVVRLFSVDADGDGDALRGAFSLGPKYSAWFSTSISLGFGYENCRG